MLKKILPLFALAFISQSCSKSIRDNPQYILNSQEFNSSAGKSSGGLDLQDGLFAYYPFDGNANDYSGNYLNGRSINTSLTSDRRGKKNSAYYFPGFNSPTGSSVNLPYDQRLALLNDFSISLWISPTEWTYNNIYSDRVVSFLGIADRYWFGAGVNYSDPVYFTFGFYCNTAIDQVQGIGDAATIGLNVWTHIAVSYDKTAAIIRHYKNGILIKQQSNVVLNMTDAFRETLVGAGNLYGLFYNGKMDELRFYDRVLTDKEIKALAR